MCGTVTGSWATAAPGSVCRPTCGPSWKRSSTVPPRISVPTSPSCRCRCGTISRPRASPSSTSIASRSARPWPRPASTATGRRSTANRPGACSRSTPGSWGKTMAAVMHLHSIEHRHPALAVVDAAVSHAVEIVAALLVVAEIVVLLTGVVSRYLLHTPIVWSDELASILFLWLAMLGAVVALRRGEHMRMTALVGRASPGVRAFLETVAIAAPVVFLLLLIAVLRLLGVADWRHAVGALATVAALAGVFMLLEPFLRDLGNLNLLIFFVGLVALGVLSGAPIAFCFGLATLGYLSLTTDTPLVVVVGRMDEGMSHLILLSVPLFVFLGLLIEMTGMAAAMVAFLASLLGHVRGGLSYVLVGAMYLVSGISGSKAADMAAVAPVLFPEMKARGAKPGDLVALLAATGAQTETIPPSLVLITIGSVTGV